jgi:uncharacterized iron-regulated protein
MASIELYKDAFMNVTTAVKGAIAASFLITSTSAFSTVTKDQVVEHYADLAHAVFMDASITAQELDTSINTFLVYTMPRIATIKLPSFLGLGSAGFILKGEHRLI